MQPGAPTSTPRHHASAKPLLAMTSSAARPLKPQRYAGRTRAARKDRPAPQRPLPATACSIRRSWQRLPPSAGCMRARTQRRPCASSSRAECQLRTARHTRARPFRFGGGRRPR
eukprot:scaffold3606_cov188-Prasinococcus_capsulatus_cf.AAC.1